MDKLQTLKKEHYGYQVRSLGNQLNLTISAFSSEGVKPCSVGRQITSSKTWDNLISFYTVGMYIKRVQLQDG